MEAKIVAESTARELYTDEGCFIAEVWNRAADPALSIARARVGPNSATVLHCLDVDERYLITSGSGIMEVEGLPPTEVAVGDVVTIPAGKSQRIRNTSDCDLVFYCLCSPRFEPHHYHELEAGE